MGLRLGDVAPNFNASTTKGEFDFHEYTTGSWTILFSHPEDFTPVCTTELGAVARLAPEWAKRNVKVLGLSCNTLESHQDWIADINETQ
ncbi:Peroxiredoxin-6, partial [Blyttiomyces sp. JEL0837]